jgi:hypothetical protein
MALPFALALGAAALVAACGVHFRSGSGEAVKGIGAQVIQEYKVETFNNLDVSHAFQCTFTHAKHCAVSIQAYENLFQCFDVKCSGNCLHISVKDGKGIDTDVPVKVNIAGPDLDKVSLSGAVSCDVVTPAGVQEKLTLDLSGATRFQMEHGAPQEVKASLSGSSQARVCVAGDLDAKLSGASTLAYQGSCASAEISASGSATVDGSKAPVQSMKIKTSGAASAHVVVEKSLDAETSGTSEVTYVGDPAIVSQKTSGVSRIIKK